MISPKKFYDYLIKKNIDFFSGVPDSLLKDICAYIDDHSRANQHVISANEGNSVAIAAGYHLATGLSGLGKLILNICLFYSYVAYDWLERRAWSQRLSKKVK